MKNTISDEAFNWWFGISILLLFCSILTFFIDDTGDFSTISVVTTIISIASIVTCVILGSRPDSKPNTLLRKKQEGIMYLYDIYHPKGKGLNSFCEMNKYEYILVACVIAKDENEAFKMAQNDFGVSYQKLGIRSTSVGDIIVESGDQKVGLYPKELQNILLVEPIGFSLISSAWLEFSFEMA